MSPEELVEFRAKEKERTRLWAEANPERVKARVRKANPDKQCEVAERKAARALKVLADKPARLEREKAWKVAHHAANREKFNQGRIERYQRDRQAHLAKCKKWAQENREQLAEYKRSYNVANKEKIQERTQARAPETNARLRQRRAEDIEFAITGRLRKRMAKALFAQGAKRAKGTFALIGCSGEQFRAHIEAQFLRYMTWDNRSEWHLDHKLPCASFDLTDPLQQVICFHYTNIRPIWGADNMRKGAKVLPEFLQAAEREAA
jgi:hypothetical protein